MMLRLFIQDIYIKKNITKLIKFPQEICDNDAKIDFTNKDTKLLIESVLKKK